MLGKNRSKIRIGWLSQVLNELGMKGKEGEGEGGTGGGLKMKRYEFFIICIISALDAFECEAPCRKSLF